MKDKKKTKTIPRQVRWDKLDNTAHLFPSIAGESMTNVYRISVTLKEEVQVEFLQQALDMILPKFDGFNLRMRTGVFWYYFEENGKKAPKVTEEAMFPCRFIRQNKNRNYLFRVTYYKSRINLEVFHVLTDGMGGINFLRELTYQYLRLVHPELAEKEGNKLSGDTSLSREDSFVRNYRSSKPSGFNKEKAYLIKNYPIPNTKEDIFEFMMAASSNVLREEEKEIYEAWLIKLEQTYQKAKILFSGDSDFKKIQQIYNNCAENIEAENQRKINIFVFETALRNGIFGVGIVILVAAVIVDRTGGNASLMELAGGIVLIASAAGLVRRQAASIDYLVSAGIGLLMLWLASMFYNGSLVQLCAGIELIVTAVNYFKSRKHSTK